MKGSFSIAYGNYTQRKAMVVELSHLDKKGYGECVEIDYYGINLEQLTLDLVKIQPIIEQSEIITPFQFYEFLLQNNLHPFLCSALDCAYWDLYGKLEGKSFAELQTIPTTNLVESSITISIDTVEEQVEKIMKSSWNKFKIKCNGFSSSNLELFLKLGVQFSLDANSSFTKEDCCWLQGNTNSQNILYIEQPLLIGNFHCLDSDKFVNWMADEDAQNANQLDKLLTHYSTINIKLMKCGGLTPALSFIENAKKLGFKVMLGCMTESSIGISAACALSGLLDFADLDGANLISNDYATGSFVENGKIYLSEKPGLGISIL